MKNTLVRGFVVVLALAGFAGSTVVSKAATTVSANTTVNTIPPMCTPKDPNNCQVD